VLPVSDRIAGHAEANCRRRLGEPEALSGFDDPLRKSLATGEWVVAKELDDPP
jgi:hypothetical protein